MCMSPASSTPVPFAQFALAPLSAHPAQLSLDHYAVQAATEICPVRLTGADPALKGFAGTALANVSYKVAGPGGFLGKLLLRLCIHAKGTS